ncbi:hypothetical protein A2U01_0038843 [Trifolium medium]|uniref:Uncharacterized protein n=1 Tax=Trifolium medium TaxID=97028 RepID=A0A392PZW9_9FABA|nr:hypothetical protein [Trifolium medium]
MKQLQQFTEHNILLNEGPGHPKMRKNPYHSASLEPASRWLQFTEHNILLNVGPRHPMIQSPYHSSAPPRANVTTAAV